MLEKLTNIRLRRRKEIEPEEVTFQKVLDLLGELNDNVKVKMNYLKLRFGSKYSPSEAIILLGIEFKPYQDKRGRGVYVDATDQAYSSGKSTQHHIKLISGKIHPPVEGSEEGIKDRPDNGVTIDYLVKNQ